ncbi:hypothetical protein B0I72DRAFT_132379 [Yarrowia lipolytica]|uniref:Uncharacterized protein n=1 Tax=Yarrowia lipolytica TaxID=4952 RepID=A0A371CET3_YARLL|nr:hypothetical protein B0I71DRAFT_127009 [Yarrowia lipolytica]RDW35757.1 hypothetical protein B0I72DRAFT_132379 [Yarrowia lipolytica]RDW38731.1 hypothetical protein B0I73DRAFT_133188 [Yarrowia lipolytica]RDW49203.1 hypothetical protein B0I74DRAFT_132088 [Yarrowia lipolytica]RDW54389.1 hypothetical protein B0I75DRAFT_134621 [Yarrowia lipolytica]
MLLVRTLFMVHDTCCAPVSYSRHRPMTTPVAYRLSLHYRPELLQEGWLLHTYNVLTGEVRACNPSVSPYSGGHDFRVVKETVCRHLPISTVALQYVLVHPSYSSCRTFIKLVERYSSRQLEPTWS